MYIHQILDGHDSVYTSSVPIYCHPVIMLEKKTTQVMRENTLDIHTDIR